MTQSLTLPASLDSLDSLAEFLSAASEQAQLSSQAAYKLQLAVDEIVTNIIVHGYQERGLQGSVLLSASIDPTRLTIIVEDTAGPFDPTQMKPPQDLDQPLENRNMGGLGVYLARRSVDEFNYERVGDRNRNIFVQLRSPH